MVNRWRKSYVVWFLVLSVVALGGVASANEKVEVTLWHHWDGERMELVEKLINDFMAENPDIHVTQLFSPPTLSNADRLISFILGGAAPEIVMVNSAFGIQIANIGGFMALDDLIDRDNIDLGMFNSADLRGFQLHGRTYAFPVMSGIAWTNVLYYNKQLMDEAGLDSESPPTTWAQWREAALRMTRRSPDGRLVQLGTQLPGVLEAAYWNGANIWGDDWRTPNVVSDRVEEAATFLHDLLMAQNGSFGDYSSFWGSSLNVAFLRGEAGFWRQNSSGFAHLQHVDFEWGAALAPASGLHPDAQPVGLVESTWAYAIPNSISPDKQEATWRLFKYLTTHENGAGWFARVQGRPSPVTAFNTHHEYRDQNPYWNTVIESANHVEFAPPINLGPIRAPLNRIMRGEWHPQQGMEEAELALRNELNRYWQAID